MESKPKIIIVVGPTASGKSDLAVKLAEHFGGEIISADSRQVYRGLNIGSGKITKSEMRGVKHHLLDVADPKRTYSASRYQRDAAKVIKEVLKRGKLPIVVGGTGFYVDAVVNGLSLPEVKPNPKLRNELEKLSLPELLSRLKQLDPERVKNIDVKNPRRLIRAIEVATELGKVPALTAKQLYNPLWIGIALPQDKLKGNIARRLTSRLKLGMIAEVRRLRTQGLSWKRLESFGLEYKHVALFLQKKVSRQEMERGLRADIEHYAKRQMTWFKRNKNITWLTSEAKAKHLVQNFVVDKKPH